MDIDNLKFRAVIRITVKNRDHEDELVQFHVYGVDVLDTGDIQFPDSALSDAVRGLELDEETERDVYDYMSAHNTIGQDDTYRISFAERIEQSTGIRDKHGRLIYEGDIVIMEADCLCADIEQVGKPCIVEWQDMAFGFHYPQLEGEHVCAGWNECAEYEIIGNTVDASAEIRCG